MLQEQDRQKLDSIVQQMVANNESDQNIQMVVGDFKTKYDKPRIFQSSGNVSPVFGGAEPNADLAIGVGQSLGSTLDTLSKGGQFITNKTGRLFGLKERPYVGLGDIAGKKDLLTPKNEVQQAGKTMGDIGQFFIPGGAEKQAITSIDKAIDATKFTERFGPEAAQVAKRIFKTIASGAVTGASTAGITALEGGDAKTAGVVGGIAGALGKAASIFGPEISQSIAKSSLRLSPATEAKVGAKAEKAAKFISENNLSVNPSKSYKQLVDINTKLEDAMKASVGNDVKVSKKILLEEISRIPEQYKNQPAIYQEVVNDVNKAIKTINDTQDNYIALDSLLSGKRSYGKSAFGKATAQVKGSLVLSEGDYALEQAYENTLEGAMTMSKKSIKIPDSLKSYFGGRTEVSLPEFNKVYSNAINAKKFTNIAQFKNDTGLVGRFFGLWAGSAVGETLLPGLAGKIGGGAMGEIVANRASTAGRQIFNVLPKLTEKTAVPAAKAGLGSIFKSNQ